MNKIIFLEFAISFFFNQYCKYDTASYQWKLIAVVVVFMLDLALIFLRGKFGKHVEWVLKGSETRRLQSDVSQTFLHV